MIEKIYKKKIYNKMRTNKFRVWNTLEKKFAPVDYYHLCMDGTLLDSDGYSYSQDYHIIQWFTGLIDKNNREIYEGDIVVIDLHKIKSFHVVEWENYGFTFNEIDNSGSIPALDIKDNIEVIGNIFQPPCKPDHNQECLVCDELVGDCAINRLTAMS